MSVRGAAVWLLVVLLASGGPAYSRQRTISDRSHSTGSRFQAQRSPRPRETLDSARGRKEGVGNNQRRRHLSAGRPGGRPLDPDDRAVRLRPDHAGDHGPHESGSAAGRPERPLVRRAHARVAAGADIRPVDSVRASRRARQGAGRRHRAQRSRRNGRRRWPFDQRQPQQRRVHGVRAAARHRQQPAEAPRGLQLRRRIPDGQLGVGRESVLADWLDIGQAVVRRHAGVRHVPGSDQSAMAAERHHAVARLPGRVDDERDHAVRTDADGPGASG